MRRRNEGAGTSRPRRPAPSDLPLEDQITAARDAALRLLAVRERSAMELRTKLRTKGYSAEAVTRVLDRLAETGLQDDGRFATLYAESARSRGYASRRVERDLRSKGVATVTSVEAATERPEDEVERARALIARRAASMASLPPEVRARRLAGFLQRRGYGPDTVAEVLADLTQPD